MVNSSDPPKGLSSVGHESYSLMVLSFSMLSTRLRYFHERVRASLSLVARDLKIIIEKIDINIYIVSVCDDDCIPW